MDQQQQGEPPAQDQQPSTGDGAASPRLTPQQARQVIDAINDVERAEAERIKPPPDGGETS